MKKTTVSTEKEQIRGRFKPGVSGNPAGRKRGALNKSTMAAMALLRGEAVGITRVVICWISNYSDCHFLIILDQS